jgi:putative transposase
LKCHLYRIGGIDDHFHILTAIPSTMALAKYVQEIKASNSHWLKGQPVFPRFESWQDGYGAFTVSFGEKDGLIEYIKGQAEHHRRESYLDEYRHLLIRHGITFDERYLALRIVSPLRGCARSELRAGGSAALHPRLFTGRRSATAFQSRDLWELWQSRRIRPRDRECM